LLGSEFYEKTVDMEAYPSGRLWRMSTKQIGLEKTWADPRPQQVLLAGGANFMSEKSKATENSPTAHKMLGVQRQKTAPRSAAAPAGQNAMVTSGSPPKSGQRIRQATKGALGATKAALSQYTSTANNPAATARLAAARAQLTSRLTNPAYQESLGRAAKRFKDFNLSKFAKSRTPDNYIDPKKVNDRTAIHAKHRELIEKQLKNLKEKETPNNGMTLAFPVERLDEVKKALPGMGEKGGKIELQHLLTYLRGRMNGTSFYSRGNPVITRLTTEMKARAQARKIIEKIKKQAGKEGMAVATGDSSHGDRSHKKEEAHGYERTRGSRS
jgi:hypothetical protein